MEIYKYIGNYEGKGELYILIQLGLERLKKTLIPIPLEFLTVFKTFLQEKEGRVLINQSNLVVDFDFKIQKKYMYI